MMIGAIIVVSAIGGGYIVKKAFNIRSNRNAEKENATP